MLNDLYLLPSSVLLTALWEGFELLSPFCRWETGSGTLNALLEIIQPKSNHLLPLPDQPPHPLPMLHFLLRTCRFDTHFHPPGSFWKIRTVPCISVCSAVLVQNRTFNNYFIFCLSVEFSSSPSCAVDQMGHLWGAAAPVTNHRSNKWEQMWRWAFYQWIRKPWLGEEFWKRKSKWLDGGHWQKGQGSGPPRALGESWSHEFLRAE